MQTNATDRFTKIYLTIWGVFLLIAFIGLILFNQGYRLVSGFKIVRVSAIEITTNQTDEKIFLNNREEKAELVAGKYVISKITPGVHSIIVSKDGYWPWTKTLTLTENRTHKTYAFLMPIGGISTKIVPKNSKEFVNTFVQTRISQLPIAQLDSPALTATSSESAKAWLARYAPLRKISDDGTTALYTENNTIHIVWLGDSASRPDFFCDGALCTSDTIVLVSITPIKSVDFYKDRNDVIMFSSGSALYAIETNKEGVQNFQPFFRGTDPYFFKDQSGTLYIRDNSVVGSATL